MESAGNNGVYGDWLVIIVGEAGSPECIERSRNPDVIQRDLSHSVPGFVIGPRLLRKAWGPDSIPAAGLQMRPWWRGWPTRNREPGEGK